MASESNSQAIAYATDDDRTIPKECMLEDGGFWLFGYGSMLWKVTFRFEEERVGSIEGFVRRFWQGSADHRGTPEHPGRVATLVPSETGKTWGKAYRIGGSYAAETAAHLDDREKGGYSAVCKTMTLVDGSELPVVLYSALPSSRNLIADEPMETTAKIIAASVGPSGPNTDYLYNMNAALRDMMSADSDNKVGHVCDEYCFELEARVRAIANASSPP